MGRGSTAAHLSVVKVCLRVDVHLASAGVREVVGAGVLRGEVNLPAVAVLEVQLRVQVGGLEGLPVAVHVQRSLQEAVLAGLQLGRELGEVTVVRCPHRALAVLVGLHQHHSPQTHHR